MSRRPFGGIGLEVGVWAGNEVSGDDAELAIDIVAGAVAVRKR